VRKRPCIIDRAITTFARHHWGSRLDTPAIVVSHLGRGGLLWLATDAALQARGRERPLPSRHVVRAVALSYGSSLLLARLLRRDRPCHGDGEALIECPDGPGLPSDQTAAAFAAAGAISRRYPSLSAPLYAAATAIALARVYCGVHYLSDTAAGAAFGVITAAITSPRRSQVRGGFGWKPLRASGLSAGTRRRSVRGRALARPRTRVERGA
jgi:membrane-associated phospholipid phosphatase